MKEKLPRRGSKIIKNNRKKYDELGTPEINISSRDAVSLNTNSENNANSECSLEKKQTENPSLEEDDSMITKKWKDLAKKYLKEETYEVIHNYYKEGKLKDLSSFVKTLRFLEAKGINGKVGAGCIDVPLTFQSTNDYIAWMTIVPLSHLAIAFGIYFTQCLLIVFVITESLNNGFDPNSNATNIDGYRLLFIVYPFLALYLGGQFSEQANSSIVGLFSLILVSLSKSLQQGSRVGQFITKVVVLLFCWIYCLFISPFLLPFWSFDYLLRRCVSHSPRLYRLNQIGKLSLIIMETIQACLMIAALIFVIQEQTDIISILFNFAGLMIILELDDIAAKFLDLDLKVWVPKIKESEARALEIPEEAVVESEEFRYFFGGVIFVSVYVALCFHAFPTNLR